ncbi:hypothetical protein IFM89_021514 [Coptis chinensis]|uniref:Peptidase A1 domain-containing protein n=1 Tax=Coptis chinensis TaxID=261450 RepID=A0A835LK25_9MAGN|nr:hypothetical protein IFM89_021514 [Coptis chinensis]
MPSSSSSYLIFLPFFFFLISPSSSSPTPITLSLSHLINSPFSDPFQKLTHLTAASLTRAKHLKNPQTTNISTTPLSPHSYGAYSVSLSFGTPPQTIPLIFDTGSELVWVPCTHRYICRNCTSSTNTQIPTFIPKLSSSTKIIGCKNPKCSWIHTTNVVESRCKDCEPNSTICSQICPPYIIIYGSASTGGILLSETLDLVSRKVPNFAVGCSLFASHSPAGIAGFGRGSASLPSQLGLSKFSYCLLSHRFDDSTQSSSLVLDGELNNGDSKTNGVSYTPFVKNPVTGRPAFSVYYYVGLRKITVGDKTVKIPYSKLSQRAGNGGAIVDSGSTFTFMEGHVFEPVAAELEKQTAHYKRLTDVENVTGLRPCYDISGGKPVSFPKLVFHFKGGADMELPVTNYFSLVGDGIACMTIITDGVVGGGGGLSGGPAVILGNFQMQNFYVEYDLENKRFGFRQQTCK